MTRETSLDEIWESTPPGEGVFLPDRLSGLPEAAGRYLEHAIAPGTKLASAVRLRMHGEIKLREWLPFRAEEVLCRGPQFVWRASVRMRGLPLRGSDRLVGGAGSMRWKLLGLFPVMTASGPDITRSAIGRAQAEYLWLPSLLAGDGVSWTAADALHPRATLPAQGQRTEIAFAIDATGRLVSVTLQRWGNPEGAAFRLVDFGGIVEDERTFDGYTIPSRLRIGWHFGSEHFEPEGEFFRATVDDATFR
jgi:hypothetical protein